MHKNHSNCKTLARNLVNSTKASHTAQTKSWFRKFTS